MDIKMTPHEAFRHFADNYKGEKQSDFYEALYALEGKRKYTLGIRRIKNLLEKYAPGVYEFHEGEPYFLRKE